MKKLLIATIAALTVLASISLFTSCSKKSELTPVNIKPIVYQNENITVKVDPKLELLLIALRLADWSPFNQNAYGQDYGPYIDGVDKFFEKQKDHPFVKDIKKRGKKYTEGYFNIISIVNYISDDLTQLNVDKKNLPPELKTFWKGVNPDTFISQFNDFAKSSNYEKIWILYNPQLKTQGVNVREFADFNKAVTDWASSFFFSNSNNVEFEIISTLLTGAYYYTLVPVYDNEKIKIKAIYPAYNNKEDDWYSSTAANIICFGYIYNILNKNWELFEKDAERIVKQVYAENQITTKLKDYNIKSYITNILNLLCLLDYDYYKNNEDHRTELINTFSSNLLVKDVDKLISHIEKYTNNRNAYQDFESFVVNYLPDVLKEL